MLRPAFSILILAASIAVQASPSVDAIHDCVLRSKADGSYTFGIAQQCANVQNVDLLRTCVDQVRHIDGFNMPDTSTVCAGVHDLSVVRECISREKAENFFNEEELALLCSQK